jgi:hypothetical protein
MFEKLSLIHVIGEIPLNPPSKGGLRFMFPPFEGGLAARARRVPRRFSETRQGGSSRVCECYLILFKQPLSEDSSQRGQLRWDNAIVNPVTPSLFGQ